jgi:hypothetical protein
MNYYKTCSISPIIGLGRFFNISRIQEDEVKYISIHMGKWIFDIHVSRARRLGSVGG